MAPCLCCTVSTCRFIGARYARSSARTVRERPPWWRSSRGIASEPGARPVFSRRSRSVQGVLGEAIGASLNQTHVRSSAFRLSPIGHWPLAIDDLDLSALVAFRYQRAACIVPAELSGVICRLGDVANATLRLPLGAGDGRTAFGSVSPADRCGSRSRCRVDDYRRRRQPGDAEADAAVDVGEAASGRASFARTLSTKVGTRPKRCSCAPRTNSRSPRRLR